MLGNAIIAFIVGGAFLRAASEYNKDGLAWGAIGLASFFCPAWIVALLSPLVLALAGADRGVGLGPLTVGSLVSFAAGAAVTVWSYNKLMEKAIEEQAAKDAQELAGAAQRPNSAAARSI